MLSFGLVDDGSASCFCFGGFVENDGVCALCHYPVAYSVGPCCGAGACGVCSVFSAVKVLSVGKEEGPRLA